MYSGEGDSQWEVTTVYYEIDIIQGSAFSQ